MMDERAALEVSAVRALETQRPRAGGLDRRRSRLGESRCGRGGGGRDGRGRLCCPPRAAGAGAHRRTPQGAAARRACPALASVDRVARSSSARSCLAWPSIASAAPSASICSHLRSSRCSSGTSACTCVLAGGFVVRYGDAGNPGPVRRLVMRVASRSGLGHGGGRSARGDAGRIIGASMAALTADWFRLAAPLYTMRAARILHFAAAALALGVIAGLYVRGLAFEYRATWESTFLDAANVHWLLAALLAPGSALSGIAMPGVAQLESIRAPASENAATVAASARRERARDRGDPASSAWHRNGHRGAASRSAGCHSAWRAVLPAPAARLPRRTGPGACHPVQLCRAARPHSPDWRRSSPARSAAARR